MKLKKIAFLFFCALMLSAFEVNSQQKQDSLTYYSKLVDSPKSIDDLTKSYAFFTKNKEIDSKAKDTLRIVYNLWYISSVQYKLGAYYDSENSAIEGIRLLDKLPINKYNNQFRVSLLNQIGIIGRNLDAYKTAIKSYKLALGFAKSKFELARLHNNLGMLYYHENKMNLSLEEFKKAYTLSLEINDSINIARALDNEGFVRAKLKKTKALSMMLKALEIRIKKKDHESYTSYKHLTEYFRDIGDVRKSKSYAKQAYSVAKKYNYLPYKLDALRNLLNLKEYKYLNEYLILRDNVEKDRLLKENKYSTEKYNLDKEKEKTIRERSERKKAELDKEKEKTKRIQSEAKANRNFFIAISISLIALFVYYVLKSRHKKEKLQERFDTERQISKKLHDEVANSIYHTMSKQQNKTDVDIALIDDLEDIYLKARDISKTSAALNISEHFDEDLKDLIWSYKTDSVNIFTRNISEMPWNNLSTLKKETIYRVLQELMTNMKKYSEASVVSLQFEKTSRKIVIHYSDNGIGCILKKSNGLQNVENRMHEIGGTIIFESEINKGFQVKITV